MKIVKVWFDDTNIYIVLDTHQTIGNPLAWFPRLQEATPAQRERYEIGSFADDLHWEELDEDLNLDGFLDFKNTPTCAG